MQPKSVKFEKYFLASNRSAFSGQYSILIAKNATQPPVWNQAYIRSLKGRLASTAAAVASDSGVYGITLPFLAADEYPGFFARCHIIF